MAIETALAVGTNIEDMWKFEVVFVVHGEAAGDEDEHASLDGALLYVLVVDSIGDGLKAEGLDFFADFLDALVVGAVVSHVAEIVVEVDQILPILHDGGVVGFQELLGESLHLVVLLHTLIYLILK